MVPSLPLGRLRHTIRPGETLKLIGAGLPRTATTQVIALEQIGLGPCS
ncbi:MAG: hypothetical protein ACRDL0_10880 [Thermoleophilaceae bacterium]